MSRYEHDKLKIFVGNVDDRTTQEELLELFERYGTVASCAVMKQYAFVHMKGKDRAMKAIQELNGRELHGKKMVVELSKPRPQHTWKIFVGNVGTACDASELRSMFETYGRVVECDIVKDYAFVHMERESDAREAIENLNGKELKGKRINVELSNKIQKPLASNGSSYSGRSHRSNDYRGMPQGREEMYDQRRATEAAYASYALKSPYERYSAETSRYDSFESRPRPPSPLYYSRDRSPMRRSPSRSAYSAAASAVLASKYRSQAATYGSEAALASAYGSKASVLASVYGNQSSALSSAYSSQSSYGRENSAYGTEPVGSYGAQRASPFGTQASSLVSSYGSQAGLSASSPYASSALASTLRQQSSALESSLGQSSAYSSLASGMPMYERTRLSPPRTSLSDGYKNSSDSLKRFASDRRYSELSDYRRLTESEAAYSRSPPRSQMDFRRTSEPSDYSQYASYSDYLRAAQLHSSYPRRM